MERVALIDGDIVAFRCAATCNNEAFKIAVYRMEDMLDGIFRAIVAKEYKMYLTGKGSYRKELDPLYKANRKDMVPPIHLSACRDYLASKWNASVTDMIEADDALGIEQCLYLNSKDVSTVICSIDKDLLQIPGKHYNFLHEKKSKVTELEGLQHFYKQLLIGDTSDNIKGIKGIGKVGAGKIVDPLEDEDEMYKTIREIYNDDERLHRNCDLLWIQRNENEKWSDRYETSVGKSEGQEPSEVDEGLDPSTDRLDPRRC
jgi:5'-3' exonuclease